MDNPTNQPPKTTSRVTMWIVLIVVVIALGIGAYFLLNQGVTNTNNANTAITNATTNKNVNLTGNTNVVTNSNTNSIANANVDTSGWKTYTNTKYGYSVRVPQSWGRISEMDGSLDANLNKQSTQNTSTLLLGPSDVSTEELLIQVDENKTLDQFLKEDAYTTGSGTNKTILRSSEFTTVTGISGRRVDLVSSATGYDFAYVFPRGSNLVDLRFLRGNADALNIINTLTFSN